MANRKSPERPGRVDVNHVVDERIAEDLIVGPHAVFAALKEQPGRVDCVWVAKDRADERIAALLACAQGAHVTVHRSPRPALDRLAPGLPHQGVIARRRPMERPQERDLQDHLAAIPEPLLLVLDGVQDPHNLGACLRSAEAAGVHFVILPRHARAPLSAAACRAACGAAERIVVYEVANLSRTLKSLKEAGVWLLGATADADTSLHECDLPTKVAWVLGGEGSGLRRLTREACDLLVRIPMQGQAESLNVSVSAGLCLYESVRARRKQKP